MFIQTHQLFGHVGAISNVSWSPDGTLICTSSERDSIRLWNAQSGKCVFNFSPAKIIIDISWSPSGKYICIESFCKSFTVLAVETLHSKNFGHGNAYCWNPTKEHHLCTDSIEHTAAVWDVETGKCIQNMAKRVAQISTAAWSPNGNMICTGSFEGDVILWDATNGTLLHNFKTKDDSITRVVWVPGSTGICVVSSNETVHIWNAVLKTCTCSFDIHSDYIISIAFSPTGNQVCLGTYCDIYDSVSIWDTQRGTIVRRLNHHQNTTFCVDWNQVNSELICTGSYDNTAHVWDTKSGACLQTIQPMNRDPTSSKCVPVAWSPNGTRLCTAFSDNSVRILWDPTKYQLKMYFMFALTQSHQKVNNKFAQHVLKFFSDNCGLIPFLGRIICDFI